MLGSGGIFGFGATTTDPASGRVRVAQPAARHSSKTLAKVGNSLAGLGIFRLLGVFELA
jgi:hypothetical protein